jgi:hypothetical protein
MEQAQSNQRTWTKTSVVMRGNWQYNRSALSTDWPRPKAIQIVTVARCPTTQAMYRGVGIEGIASEIGELDNAIDSITSLTGTPR